MLIADFNNNTIHFRFKDACTPDDVEDMYDFFGIHSFDCNDETVVIYDFSWAYFKDNGFFKSFVELAQAYPFKCDYFTGLKALGDVMFEKFTSAIGSDKRNFLLEDDYESLCNTLKCDSVTKI